MRRLLTLTALSAAMLLTAGGTASGAWTVRTVPTSADATLLALDAAPDGRIATLYTDDDALTLRVGATSTVLEREIDDSIDVDLGHDAQGRFTVAWTLPRTGVVVWTEGRREELQMPQEVVLELSLAVAPDGSAAVASSGYAGQWVARRTGGEAPFTATVEIDSRPGDETKAAITRDGEAVIAWEREGGFSVTRALAGAAFPRAQRIRVQGKELTGLQVTHAGLVVLSGRSLVAREDGGSDRRSVLATWPRSGTPSAIRVLSPAGRDGSPTQALARGSGVLVAWRDVPHGRGGTAPARAARLGLGVVDASGALRTRRVTTGAGSGGVRSGPTAIAERGDAGATVVLQGGPRNESLTAFGFDAALQPTHVQQVNRRDDPADDALAAQTGRGRPVVAYSASGGRIRLASPRA